MNFGTNEVTRGYSLLYTIAFVAFHCEFTLYDGFMFLRQKPVRTASKHEQQTEGY